MKEVAVKINADYEINLFTGTTAPAMVNHSLEYLYFFLGTRPVLSAKKYSPDYLDFIEKFTGVKPRILPPPQNYENWWGSLSPKDLMSKLNSKITSAEIIIREGWCSKTKIIKHEDDLFLLDPRESYLLKEAGGASGTRIEILKPEESPSWKKTILHHLMKSPLVIEPLLNRKYDFSTYVFPDGKMIHYENRVDANFQYKGTVFHRLPELSLANLSFYSKLEKSEWDEFEQRLKIMMKDYHHPELHQGYSIDSFVFEENGKLKIRPLSEVNYRKTMGSLAYEFYKKYFSHYENLVFELVKPGKYSFKDTDPKKNFFVLSPGDTRFDYIITGVGPAFDKGLK